MARQMANKDKSNAPKLPDYVFGIPGKTYKTNPDPKTRVAIPTGKTKVSSGKGFDLRGMQGQSSFRTPTKSEYVDLALMIATAGSSAAAQRAGAAIAKKWGEKVAADTFKMAAKGISQARAGGRVYKSSTVFGKTLASSKLLTKAELTAAQKGLATRAGNIAAAAGRSAGKIGYRVGSGAVKGAVGGAVAGRGLQKAKQNLIDKKKAN